MRRLLVVFAAAAALSALLATIANADPAGRPSTPIRHVVIIFQENVSFDHYFGTYPDAANTDGQPFHASPCTPAGRRPAPGHQLPRCRRACGTPPTC